MKTLMVAVLLVATLACSSTGVPPTEEPGNPPPTVTTIAFDQPTPEATTIYVPPPTAAPLLSEGATATPIPSPRSTSTPLPTTTPNPIPSSTPASTAMPTPSPTPLPAATPTPSPTSLSTWRGILIVEENRCSPYDSDDYPYSQSVEADVVESMGGIIYSPYNGQHFESTKETDIEHIVARSEAHDSGLCAASMDIRSAFAEDVLNLTLASPSVNRHQKSDNDAVEWLPELNQCWYAGRIVEVRQTYDLTIDQAEANVLERILSGCSSTAMVIVPAATPTATPMSESVDALALYDSNGNGRITCAEAREHGIAPVREGHPAYEFMTDRDGDGVVCE